MHSCPHSKAVAQTSYLHGDPHALQYVQKLLVVVPGNDVATPWPELSPTRLMTALVLSSTSPAATIRSTAIPGARRIRRLSSSNSSRQTTLFASLRAEAQLHPDRADLQYNLAVAQIRTHHPAEAIKTLAPLATQKDSDLLNLLASAYIQPTSQTTPFASSRALSK